MQVIPQFFVLVLIAVFMSNGNAQDDSARASAFEACIQETGLTRPEPGVRPSQEDREKIKTCMSQKGFSGPGGGHREMNPELKAAFEACASENNIQRPERGTPPSDEDRQKMESCLTGKGFSLPVRPEGSRGRGASASAQ